MTSPWGYSLGLDLKCCDPVIIRSREKIQEYVLKLCKEIDMQRHGDIIIEHFGSDNKEGYSMVQLIETSCITAHFANESNSAYIDIFSCKAFEMEKVVELSMEFFGSKEVTTHLAIRGANYIRNDA